MANSRQKIKKTTGLIVPLALGVLVIITSILITNKNFSSLLKSKAATSDRPIKYYMVDRVRSGSDFATLAGWGINTAVVAIPTNGSDSSWQSVYNAAHTANINIVIWPLDPGGDNNCGWESPFYKPVDGNYIGTVTKMMDWWANKPGVIGIVTFHEPMWESSTGCKDSIADLSSIYQQIHSYTNNPNFEVYGYIDNIVDAPQMTGFQSYADMDKIMDVAVTWHHCAGNVEGNCEGGSNSALGKINNDRAKLASVNSRVKLIFLMQTFTMGSSYGTKFTLSELENYSCDFLNTKALDGFGFYTWDEGWYSGNLKKWTDLQPAVAYINSNCIYNTGTTPFITTTPTNLPKPTNIPTLVPTHIPTATTTFQPTRVPTPTVTKTPTPRPTNIPTNIPKNTNTPSPIPTVQSSNIMQISSIYYDFSRNWWRTNRVGIHIKVVDNETKNPVLFARVYYTVTNKTTGITWSNSGYTNYSGVETYNIYNVPKGCYTTSISKVTTVTGRTWDGISPKNEACY
jgi:hypothetical protein